MRRLLVFLAAALCAGLLVSVGSASRSQKIGPTVRLTDDSPYYARDLHGFWVDGHTADYRDLFRHRLYHGSSYEFEGKMLIDFTLEEETSNRDLIKIWLVSFFGSTSHYNLTTSEIIRGSVPGGVRVRHRCWARDRGTYDC